LRAAGVEAVAGPSDSVVGGGGAPGVVLESAAVVLPASYALPLRTGEPAVVGRVENGGLLLDLRCVPDDDELFTAVTRVTEG
jgi:L-seryl-tRNA(Ser) seleniumtransferase